jgi:hypothetical protein
MNVKPRMTRKPIPDRCGLVRAVVVHHQMHVQFRLNVGLNGPQKAQEFATAVTPMEFSDNFTRSNIQCGK